jgi:hypothetical protein
LLLESLACTGTAHRPLQAYAQRNLFELFAVFVLAIVSSMDQLVNQCVKNLDRVTQGWRNEDLISFIGAASA